LARRVPALEPRHRGPGVRARGERREHGERRRDAKAARHPRRSRRVQWRDARGVGCFNQSRCFFPRTVVSSSPGEVRWFEPEASTSTGRVRKSQTGFHGTNAFAETETLRPPEWRASPQKTQTRSLRQKKDPPRSGASRRAESRLLGLHPPSPCTNRARDHASHHRQRALDPVRAGGQAAAERPRGERGVHGAFPRSTTRASRVRRSLRVAVFPPIATASRGKPRRRSPPVRPRSLTRSTPRSVPSPPAAPVHVLLLHFRGGCG